MLQQIETQSEQENKSCNFLAMWWHHMSSWGWVVTAPVTLTGDQGFKSMILWGTFLIQATTVVSWEAEKVRRRVWVSIFKGLSLKSDFYQWDPPLKGSTTCQNSTPARKEVLKTRACERHFEFKPWQAMNFAFEFSSLSLYLSVTFYSLYSYACHGGTHMQSQNSGD